MVGPHSFPPSPGTRFAVGDSEAQVCECYAVGKREYDRLLADYRHAEVASSARPVTRVHAFPQPNAARV